MVVEDVTLYEALVHFASIGWFVLFALVPPAEYGKGKYCFVISLCMIGGVTAVVGEIGTVFGCAVGLKESITAITIVALGTSLPDTFASMTAAKNADSADAAIGNITGSNSVNVFLGLGLPWAIAVTIWGSNPEHEKV
jgi:solute carrier family 8 (sodium/calcium exchanger)